MGRSRMTFKDLVTGADGKISHTKVWSHPGYAVMIWAFIKHVSTFGLTYELLLAFGTIFCGAASVSKWMAIKQNGNGGVNDPSSLPPVQPPSR